MVASCLPLPQQGANLRRVLSETFRGELSIPDMEISGDLSVGGISDLGGAVNYKTTVTASATLTITSLHHTIFGSLAGNQTFTLPDCTAAVGREYNIKKTEAGGTLTVDTTSSQNIEGALQAVLTVKGESITVITDGVEWFVI